MQSLAAFLLVTAALSAAAQPDRGQLAEEARAMLREDWAKYRDLMRALQVGVKCGAVDAFPADLATRRLTNTMMDEWIRAGLANDSATDPQRLTRRWVDEGKELADKPGACERLTPALRARLRKAADKLMNMP